MRIGSVDVYKFCFSWVICFYHYYNLSSPNPHFPMGEVAVELFVLISGVFLYMGWERKKQKQLQSRGTENTLSPYAYLKHRYLRFLPCTLVGFVLAFGVRTWMFTQQGDAVDLQQTLTWLSKDVWEMFLVSMNGINNNAKLLNVPVWTVSAMLIAEFVAFSLLDNKEKLFTTLICPCVILFAYGYWRHMPSANHELWIGFTTFGVLRVFALVCLAWYCWQLIKRMRQTQFTKVGSILLGICEILLYFGALVLMMNFDTRYFRWIITAMFFFAVAISISGASFTCSLLPAGRITQYLGELSMGIYLTHYPIMLIFRFVLVEPENVYRHKFTFLAVVLVAAVLFCLLARLAEKCGQRFLRLLKKVFVSTNSKM